MGRAVKCLIPALIFSLSFLFVSPATAGIVRGVGYIAAGVIEVPRSTLAGTVRSFPIGALTGALAGTVRGIVYLTRGAFELVGSAIPLAKKLIPLIPIFF